MRYYTFSEFDGENGWDTTISESEIKETYYPYWYGKMCDKFGKDHVDEHYSFEHCLEDWKTVHWACELDFSEENK